MDEIIIESYGKINLSLDVLYKRNDGYHELNTLMQQVDLKDTLTLKEIKEGIIIECNNSDVPLGSANLVYKAWEKIKERTGVNKGIHIKIDKQIPLASGLAGGSTNGAAVLKGLSELWQLNLGEEELRGIGVEIGADVPFCIMGGTAYAQGIGEKLKKLKPFSNKLVLLANPGIEVSTAYVYNNLVLNKDKRVDIDRLIRYLEEGNLKGLAENMVNVMEEVVVKDHPIISEIKKDMMKYGALGALMSGSGPTVFGIFDDEEKMIYCRNKLSSKIKKIYMCKTI